MPARRFILKLRSICEVFNGRSGNVVSGFKKIGPLTGRFAQASFWRVPKPPLKESEPKVIRRQRDLELRRAVQAASRSVRVAQAARTYF
jgi:hypothetical protein